VRSLFREYGVPVVLLAASVFTTTANGARFMQNFLEGTAPVVRDSDLWPWAWAWRHKDLFLQGWAFSFTLLGILLIHEFGHYTACRVHGISATLPWILPAPTLSGTIGAVIRIRSRIPNRNALMDVGIYGPLAGYVASILAVAVGFARSVDLTADAPDAIVVFGKEPLSIRALHALVAHWNPATPSFEHLAPHPILLAGWIGLFITSLNLIPGGQLDGGHLLYAISPRTHAIVTKVLPFVLILAGVFYWAGWILWGLILLLPAMRHPRVPVETKLSRGRLVLGFAGLAIFLATFTLTPFEGNSLLQLLRS